MTNIILLKLYSIYEYMVVKCGAIFAFLLTIFLQAIGYPKQIIFFIIALVIIDVLTRFYSETKKAYKEFNLYLFFKAWRDKLLTSRKLKNGLFVKIFFYAILLYIAHQINICGEIYIGQFISNTIYSIIVVLDIISILENMSESGLQFANVLKRFFEKQKDDLVGKDATNNKQDNNDNSNEND